MLSDPIAAGRRRRRESRIVLVAVVLAVIALVAAVVVILTVSRHQVVVTPAPATPPSSVAKADLPEVADGTVIPASDLYSDPVFIGPNRGFALATTEPDGIPSERLALSDSAGASWQITGSALPVAGDFSTLDFLDSETGYVYGPAGLLVTFSGGRSWKQAPIDGEVERVIPIGSDVWATYASCPGVPSPTESCSVGVEISEDAGLSWRPVAAEPPLVEGAGGGDVLARTSLSAAYLLSFGADDGGLVVTRDGGRRWTPLPDPCARGWSTESMAAPGNGDLWLICGGAPSGNGQPKSVYRSADAGVSWRLVASTGSTPSSEGAVGEIPLAGYVSQLATVSPKIAWLGLGGVGVARTTDGGATWSLVQGIVDAGGSADVGVTFIATGDDEIVDGWALGFGYAVWHTTNATTWRLVSGG